MAVSMFVPLSAVFRGYFGFTWVMADSLLTVVKSFGGLGVCGLKMSVLK